MVFASQWALERGFISYLNDTENLVLLKFKSDLEELYQSEQSWDSIVNDRKAWRALLRKHLRSNSETNLSSNANQGSDSKESRLPAHHGGLWRGIRLLDVDKTALISREEANQNAKEVPLEYGGKIVGYLSLNPATEIRDELGLSFAKQLVRTIQYSAFGILIISLLMAYWLAKGFVNPIKEIVSSTRALAAGDFNSRCSVTSKDELGQLANECNILAATLESNEKSRQQWIADISHELRTPLTILRGEIEAIKDGVRQMSPKLIESLHTEILHIQTIVNDLYELSLSDVGALSYKKTNINIYDVLNEALEFYEDEFESSNIEIIFENNLSTDLFILADPNRLHQLFSNLLSNSLRYTDAGGKLKIQLDHADNEVHIDFYDSSPGVAESDITKLFERLYRVDNSRNRKSGGAGLGLSICKNIVSAHQGKIEASQSKLGGLHIHIVLPKNLKE